MEQMEEQVYRFEVITSRYEAKASTSSNGNAKISIILEEDTMWDEDGFGNTRTVAAYEISMESMGYTSNRQMREPTVPNNVRNKDVNNFPSNEEWRIYKVQWDPSSREMKIPYSRESNLTFNPHRSSKIQSGYIIVHVLVDGKEQVERFTNDRTSTQGAFVKVRDTRQEIREDARATRWSLSGFQFGIFTKVIKDGELCGSREETRERR
uniref:Uncharacterized protein n=1 Tax=Vespula pensylvanica TaxID=30213 RepID=A0A834PDK4_VESPE|nr:hypothetical protein H0235_000143 [Vespula pensylvanica]